MDIAFVIMLLLLGFMFFILGLFEERDMKDSEEEETRSDHLVVLCLTVGFLLFFLGGICMLGISDTYYSIETGTAIEVQQTVYRPFVWLGVGLAFIDGLFLIEKVFEILGKSGKV